MEQLKAAPISLRVQSLQPKMLVPEPTPIIRLFGAVEWAAFPSRRSACPIEGEEDL